MHLYGFFSIATNPWSHHVQAEAISTSDPEYSESNKYRNYWGYEIDMLVNTAKVLNFTYTIENPPDGSWGHIKADGSWNGMVYHISQNIVDLVICDLFIVYGRHMVISQCGNFRLFLSLKFYVKSILEVVEVPKLLFKQF